MNLLLIKIMMTALLQTGGTETPKELITNKNEQHMESILNTPSKNLIFPELPYAYDALEPYIDKMTMEIHYSKHHKAYYDNMMKAIAGTAMESMELKEIFRTMDQHPVVVRNNAGGYYNHLLFWENMKAGVELRAGALRSAIESQWGSFDKFKEEFSAAAATRFGSGWAWLNLGADGRLFISSTPNQDNPLMNVAEKQGIPLLALDVWEHAYYLKYQNRRPEYISSFWSVVNWEMVEKRYAEALKK